MTFERFYAGSLAKGGEILETTQKRLVDIGHDCQVYTPGKTPIGASPFAYPFSPPSEQLNIKAWQQAEKEFGLQEKEFNKYNSKLLLVGGSGDYGMLSRVPMRNLEEWKGKMVVQIGGYFAEWTKVTGITPVSGITMPERYERLRTGVVDASLLAPNLTVDAKLYEVAKHHIMVGIGGRVGRYTIINLDTWKSLTPELQKLFLELAEWAQAESAKDVDKFVKEGIAFMITQGVTDYGSLSDAEKVKWAAMVPDTVAASAKAIETEYPQIWDFFKRYMELCTQYGHKWPRQFGVRQ